MTEERKCYAFLSHDVNDAMNAKKDMFLHCGVANGYVAVPPEHPSHGKEYDDMYDDISVHGGLTFARLFSYVEKNFRTCEPIDQEREAPSDLSDWWVFGFDTMHYGDSPINWNRDNVIHETNFLKRQLDSMFNQDK